MRLLVIFLLLGLVFLVPFLLFGDRFAEHFSTKGAIEWLRGYGDWAWLAAVVLLLLDLVLPIPGTAVMTALGLIYGPVLGGLIGSAGSILSGAAAYGLCRSLGRSAALRIAGARDLDEGERLFSNVGGWAVAFSRWLPLLPEVVSCMAGLTRMPASSFFLALTCGTLPMAFTFATVGHVGLRSPALCLLLSALVPLLLWPIAARVVGRSKPR